MGSLERLEIYLENSIDGKFPAGDIVYGKLILVLRRSMKIHGVEMKIRGRGHAEWREFAGLEERQLYETEEYLKQSTTVFGKEPAMEGPPHVEFLDSGQHEFPFHFSLPTHIPTSFEGMHGYIRYWVKAKVYGVWGLLDQSGKVEFGVERSLDLNKIPGAKEPAEDEDTCVMCGCCLNSGAVSASFRVNRRGFVPGDVIICNAEIWNESDTSIKSSKLKFYRVVTYGDVPFASRTREKQTFSVASRGKIKSGRECTYTDEKFEIPASLPATSLPGCSFIDVDYVVELKISSSQKELNLRIPLLIIVGTVPLSDQPMHDSQNIDQHTISDVCNSNPVPSPLIVQSHPWMTSDPVSPSALPTASAPPMATELHELHPSRFPLTTDFQLPFSETTSMSLPIDEQYQSASALATPSTPPSSDVPASTSETASLSPPTAETYQSVTSVAPPTFPPSTEFHASSSRTAIMVTPTETFSILEREKSLNEVHYNRKKTHFLRTTAAVNEGANFDDEDE